MVKAAASGTMPIAMYGTRLPQRVRVRSDRCPTSGLSTALTMPWITMATPMSDGSTPRWST